MRSGMLLAVFAVLLVSGCAKDNPVSDAPPNPSSHRSGPSGLVIVIENSDGLAGSALEFAFGFRRSQVLQVLGGIFGVDTAMMRGMKLNEIVEAYGEPWMIREMEHAAAGHYSTVIALSDERATKRTFLDSVRALSSRGLFVDLVFVLHSDGNGVWFFDGSCPIQDITAAITRDTMRVRSLYQTCCYGSAMVDDWAAIGISAVCGSVGLNDINMYSPIAFLKNWTGGEPFNMAVQHAFQQEVDTLRSYTDVFPELGLSLTDQAIAASRQICGGRKPDLLWNESPFLKRGFEHFTILRNSSSISH